MQAEWCVGRTAVLLGVAVLLLCRATGAVSGRG